MAVAFVNSGVVQPLVNQEVIVATLGGGSFDNLDAYVQGGQWDGQLSFRIYATNGAVRARVAQAAYQGPRAARLFWQVIGQTQPQSPLSCDGTSYDLVVFALPNPQNNGLNPVPPGTIQATLAGVNDGDVVADTNVSAAPVLPALGGEVVVATAAGYVERADVAVNMAGLPAVQLNLYASCGAGSVQALVQFTQTGGADQSEAVMVGVPLPVGTLFTLTAQKVVGDGVVGQACPASLATGSFASAGGGGVGMLVPLAGDIGVRGPLAANFISPRGPQISVIRAAPPIAPTKSVWASSGYVDFVVDCGADPTGVVDCTAAMNTAFGLLSTLAADPRFAETAVTLFVPPGIFRINVGGVTWNFLGKTTSVRVCGVQDASIFLLDANAAGFLGIANAFLCIIDGLTFVGNSNVNGVVDSGGLLNFNQQWLTVVRDCRFVYLTVNPYILFAQGQLRVENCEFGQSAATNATYGMIVGFAAALLDVSDCRFVDIVQLNGFSFSVSKIGSNTNYIVQIGPSQLGVNIRRCFFDEGVETPIRLIGSAAPNKLQSALIEQCTFNSPELGAPGGIIQLSNVNLAEVRAVYVQQVTANPTNPLVGLVAVDFARLRGLTVQAGTNARFVTADVTTGLVRVEDSPNFTADDLFDGTAARSLAKTNQLLSAGTDTVIECFVGLSPAAGSFVGEVAKVGATANTYTPILTTDGVGLAVAVSLDANAGVGQARFAKRGQIVTVLSDGSTAISVGDPITNLGAATAGQVKKAVATGTTPIIGIAVSPAASGGGAVLFDMLFETGEA
jgi:hypothetical protein